VPTAEPTVTLSVSIAIAEQIPTATTTTTSAEVEEGVISVNPLSMKPLQCGNSTTRIFKADEAADGLLHIPSGVDHGVFSLDFWSQSASIYIFSVDEDSGATSFRSRYNFTNSWSGHFTDAMGLRLWVLSADDSADGEAYSVSLQCTPRGLGIFSDILQDLGVDVVSESDGGSQSKVGVIVGVVIGVVVINGLFLSWCYLYRRRAAKMEHYPFGYDL